MEKALNEYFMPEYQYYLDSISYQRFGNTSLQVPLSLVCSDNITVSLTADNKVNLLLTRELKFSPEGIFSVTIRFGADLQFNPETSIGIDWNRVNLAEEFKKNGDFVIANLMSRASLLIAQITSSFGQQPLILPGAISKE